MLLDTGYSKCDEYIRLLTIGQLPCLPGCNEEESLESKILKGLFYLFYLYKFYAYVFVYLVIWVKNFLEFVTRLEKFVKRSCIQAIVPWSCLKAGRKDHTLTFLR